jgi:Fur family iron response transcriptional regulator
MICRSNEAAVCRDCESLLQSAGLRPTRQRKWLCQTMFAKGERHLTAEGLYHKATESGVEMSLATVYNTLHQFKKAGLIRQLSIGGSKAFFDTNTAPHHHFFIEGKNVILDIPRTEAIIDKMPILPEGYEVARVDILIRLRPRIRR